MALLFKFELAIMSADIYDELLLRLEKAGAESPLGRLYHVTYGPLDRLKVFDIWDSSRHFQEFGETLVPTLEEFGITLPEPDTWQVYSIIKPQRRAIELPDRLLVKFDPRGMNTGQYDEIIKRVDETGYGAPPERLYHVCYRERDDLHIISVWQSAQALRAFFDQAIRIALDLGIPEVPLTELVIEEVHHIIDGSTPVPHPPSSSRQPD